MLADIWGGPKPGSGGYQIIEMNSRADECQQAGGVILGVFQDFYGPGTRKVQCGIPIQNNSAPPAPPVITVSPQIQTQVSPQVSPVLQQQFQPQNSPATAATTQTSAPSAPPVLGVTSASAPPAPTPSAAPYVAPTPAPYYPAPTSAPIATVPTVEPESVPAQIQPATPGFDWKIPAILAAGIIGGFLLTRK